MNALIGLEDKSKLALSSSGIGLPQPGQPHRQQPRDPGPALRRVRIPSQRDHRFQTNVADSEGFLARKDLTRICQPPPRISPKPPATP